MRSWLKSLFWDMSYWSIDEISPSFKQAPISHQSVCLRVCPPQASVETSSMSQSSTSQVNQPASSDSSQPPLPNTDTDFDRVLQEAQASLMKSIPDLNVSDTREDTPLDLTLEGRLIQSHSLKTHWASCCYTKPLLLFSWGLLTCSWGFIWEIWALAESAATNCCMCRSVCGQVSFRVKSFKSCCWKSAYNRI